MFLAVSPAGLATDLSMNQGCTIAVWLSPERRGGLNGSTNMTILSRGVTTQENTVCYGLGLNPQNVPFFESRVPANWPQPGPWTRQATRSLGSGWNHVAAIFNGGAVSFYINGQPAGQAQAPARQLDSVRYPALPVYVGARFVSDVTGEIREPYFGAIDDLALLSRPLSGTDIALLASDADANGMADYWDFQITGHLPAPNPYLTTGPITTPTPTPSKPKGYPIQKKATGPGGSGPSVEGGRPQGPSPKRNPGTAPRVGPGGPETGPSGPTAPGTSVPPANRDRRMGPGPAPTQPPAAPNAPKATPTPTPTPRPSGVRRI